MSPAQLREGSICKGRSLVDTAVDTGDRRPDGPLDARRHWAVEVFKVAVPAAVLGPNAALRGRE